MLERIDKEKLDNSFEEVQLGSLSDYQKKDPSNLPTHFTMEILEEGKYKGFDKVTYFRKKLR